MYNKIIKIPGYNLNITSNSKSITNRIDQFVNIEHLKVSSNPDIDIKINTSENLKFNLSNSYNEVDHIEYSQDVENYEYRNWRIIIRKDERSNIIAILRRNLLDGEFNAQIQKNNPIALGFTMNRLEIHIAGLLNKIDYIPIHGAAVSIDGLGICFVGNSGSGKSTTIMQLLYNGANIISNDFLCLEFDDEVIRAYSLDSTIAIRKDIRYKCPLLWDYWINVTSGIEPFATENDEQRYYSVPDIFGERCQVNSEIKYIAYLSVTSTSGVVVNKLSEKEALRKFLSSIIVVPHQNRGRMNWIDKFYELYSKCCFISVQVPRFNTNYQNIFDSNEFVMEIRKKCG